MVTLWYTCNICNLLIAEIACIEHLSISYLKIEMAVCFQFRSIFKRNLVAKKVIQ